MQIERIDEYNLTTEDETRIHTLLVRAFDEDFGGRSFHQQRHHIRYIARDGDNIIGHMSLCYRSIRMGDALVRIMGLGDVSTDPDHQGKGIASALMSETLKEARASQADFYLLFGVRPMYAGNGFRAVPNHVTHTELYGARTGKIATATNPSLMVLQLRGSAWDDTAPIDLLGFSF